VFYSLKSGGKLENFYYYSYKFIPAFITVPMLTGIYVTSKIYSHKKKNKKKRGNIFEYSKIINGDKFNEVEHDVHGLPPYINEQTNMVAAVSF